MRWNLLFVLMLVCSPVFGQDQASPTVDISISGYDVVSNGSAYYYNSYSLNPATVSWTHDVIDSTTGATAASNTGSTTLQAPGGVTVYNAQLSPAYAYSDYYHADMAVSGTHPASLTGPVAGASNQVSSGTLQAPAAPSGGGGGSGTVNPDPNNGCDPSTDPWCDSPIVLNLGLGAYQLSSLDDPVTFDLDADGAPERTAWTARGTPMAFLAYDRNGNGVIDDGSELFGNHTLLPNGELAANGFDALAQYDGNHDGVIDKNDPIWNSLLLWIDWNHDGFSQPGELIPISASGVTALELTYHWSGRRDQSGNLFRYEAKAHFGSVTHPYYDIYFQSAP